MEYAKRLLGGAVDIGVGVAIAYSGDKFSELTGFYPVLVLSYTATAIFCVNGVSKITGHIPRFMKKGSKPLD